MTGAVTPPQGTSPASFRTRDARVVVVPGLFLIRTQRGREQPVGMALTRARTGSREGGVMGLAVAPGRGFGYLMSEGREVLYIALGGWPSAPASPLPSSSSAST